MQASNAAAMSSNGQSIIVIEEEEEILHEEIVHKGKQLMEEEEKEGKRPRRSTRSVSTKSAVDLSSQRRRSVEPVRYAQLQDEDAALAKLKYAQQTLFRKGEKRARSNGGGGGGGRSSSSSSASPSKRSRAEERRTARQARRRGDPRSPTLSSVAEEETDAWRALPAMALDGSGPRSLRFQRPADAVVATAAHSTAWRRVQVRGSPANLLPLGVLTPFADDLERPLESYDEALGSACRVRRHASLEEDGHEDERTEQQLETEVTRLLADATPLVARCHAARVAHVLSATRQRVRACLAQLPTARRAVSSLCRADVVPSSAVSPLECVVANRQRENVVLPADEADADDLPTYFVGKGEHSVRERAVLPKEPVRRLPSLPCLSRSTTCIGVRGTLPVDDDPILRSAPVFSSASGDAPPLAAAPPPLSALDDDRQELVLRFVVHATNGDARVFRVLRSLAWSTQPQTDYTAVQIREAHARVVQARQAAEPSVRSATSTLATRLRGGIVGDESTAPRSRRELCQADDEALLAGFRDVFCRRCYVYNCQFHGVHQPRATARTDPEYPSIKRSQRGVFAPAEEERIVEEEEEEEAVHEPPTEEEKRTEEGVGQEGEDVEMVDVRRSARSVTAAATKASTLLVVQSSKRPAAKRHAKASKRGLHDDASEYFGFDELYRTITLAKRTAMLRPAKRLKSPESPDAPDTLATAETLDVSCSSTCYKTLDTADTTVWTPHELLLLQLAHRKVGSRPCVLSHWLATKSCAQVHTQLASMQRASTQQQDALRVAQDELRLLRAGRRRDDRVASVRGNTPEHLHRTRVQRMKDRGANHQFVPCAGHACNTNDCSCMRRDHFCEQACACPRDCANRFPGCRCATPDVCGTMACLCFFSGRECDPDVCRSCAACDVPLVAMDARQRRKSNKSLRVCANTNILRGAHRRVGVAPSTTHGWGAFAREPIAAHEFIYEYTGELLSQDEAERRGNVYDRNAVSFLFDLNEDVVVDAARKGNKSKFANHAAGDAANCAARIMLVRGDHRIGLYAKRAIAAGEELFFDYGHHGVVPDWSQSRIRPSGVKGLRPGDDSANSTAPSSPRRPTGPVEDEADAMEEDEDEAREVVDVIMGDGE